MQSLLYFLLLAGLFFAMMRFGCGAHVMGHAHRAHDRDRRDKRSPGAVTGSAGTSSKVEEQRRG